MAPLNVTHDAVITEDGQAVADTVNSSIAENSRLVQASTALPKAVRRHGVLAVGAIATAIAVGLVVVLPGLRHASVRSVPASPTAPARPDPSLGGGPGCDPVRTPNLVRGNGTGSLASGPDAILAFEHGYYSLRSGTAARMAVTADATVPTTDVIDAGIATVSAGTTACVAISPLTADRYLVAVTETALSGAMRSFTQLITTTAGGGAATVRITGIRPADS